LAGRVVQVHPQEEEQMAPSEAGEVALEVMGRERPRAEALSERVESAATQSRFTKSGRCKAKGKHPRLLDAL